MILVGITGSIGCGKTTLAKIVKDLGYTVFDIDSWVRKLYFNKDFLSDLNKIFPNSVVKGVADKKYLRLYNYGKNSSTCDCASECETRREC